MNTHIRNAIPDDLPIIWSMLQDAIARRKSEGSNQWQDGYPNPEVISEDIQQGVGYVLIAENNPVGYVAILINDEPEYANLKGKWLTEGDYVVFHRVAIAEEWLGRGLAKELLIHIEDFARAKGIHSIKADTNFDNGPMLHLFEKSGYSYCGEVHFRGSPRRAFEKYLKGKDTKS